MTVRDFTHTDIDRLIELGRLAHEESEYRVMTFDENKCRSLCEMIIATPSFIGIVAEKDGQIVGCLVAIVSLAYFSDEKTGGDFLVYVMPEHRGSSAFYRLCQEYVFQARVKGARLIFLRNTTGIMPEKVGEIYERMGFEKVGGIYRMEA